MLPLALQSTQRILVAGHCSECLNSFWQVVGKAIAGVKTSYCETLDPACHFPPGPLPCWRALWKLLVLWQSGSLWTNCLQVPKQTAVWGLLAWTGRWAEGGRAVWKQYWWKWFSWLLVQGEFWIKCKRIMIFLSFYNFGTQQSPQIQSLQMYSQPGMNLKKCQCVSLLVRKAARSNSTKKPSN